MACKLRGAGKGFIHTLEALMASFMVLGFIVFLLPALREPAEAGQVQRDRMLDYLSVFDYSGDLESHASYPNANLSGLKERLDSVINVSFDYTLGFVSYYSESASGNATAVVVGGENTIIEVVAMAGNGTTDLLPEAIVWDSSGPKDLFVPAQVNLTSRRVSESQVEINFTGAGEYRYRIKKSELYGVIPQNTTVHSAAYLFRNGIIEVFFFNAL